MTATSATPKIPDLPQRGRFGNAGLRKIATHKTARGGIFPSGLGDDRQTAQMSSPESIPVVCEGM
jgi:hypothetical protein